MPSRPMRRRLCSLRTSRTRTSDRSPCTTTPRRLRQKTKLAERQSPIAAARIRAGLGALSWPRGAGSSVWSFAYSSLSKSTRKSKPSTCSIRSVNSPAGSRLGVAHRLRQNDTTETNLARRSGVTVRASVHRSGAEEFPSLSAMDHRASRRALAPTPRRYGGRLLALESWSCASCSQYRRASQRPFISRSTRSRSTRERVDPATVGASPSRRRTTRSLSESPGRQTTALALRS